ncbi:MAG: 4-hydroxyphenylacetate 3-hydroxylase N-terminal domain-containing protein [Syntrophales bacterium]
MGLMTAQEYRDSLNDGRIVYYKGRKIENVATDPDLMACVETVAVDYLMAHDPKYKDLALVYDEELGENISRYNHVPKNGEDLLKHLELIIKATELGDGYIPLAHDIGADAMNAISITARTMGDAGKVYLERIENYRTYLKKTDKCVVAGVTDVKGDRKLRPSDAGQAHPDFHVRVVDKNDEGVIVRGAKVHITGAAYCNEFFVIPCRAMSGPEDAPYAIAFAIPANTKGIRQIVRPFHGRISDMEFPLESPLRRMHTDSLIIFDDVLVPWDRVFLCGEWKMAATMVYNFALMHRRTGCAYRIPLSEQLLGVAVAIADYNGVSDAPHVREKITELVIYLETLSALSRSACLDFVDHAGIPVPNPITTNIAKYHFAHNYHKVCEIIQDLAGGLLVTAPTYRDWQNPETQADIKKYLQGKASVPTEDRLRMFDLIRRITSADLETICLHGEGSPFAERMTIFMEARKIIGRCKGIAEGLAGIKK